MLPDGLTVPSPAFTLDEDLSFALACLRDYLDEPVREDELAGRLVARLRPGCCERERHGGTL